MKQFALTMAKVLTSKNQEIPNCSARNYVLSINNRKCHLVQKDMRTKQLCLCLYRNRP